MKRILISISTLLLCFSIGLHAKNVAEIGAQMSDISGKIVAQAPRIVRTLHILTDEQLNRLLPFIQVVGDAGDFMKSVGSLPDDVKNVAKKAEAALPLFDCVSNPSSCMCKKSGGKQEACSQNESLANVTIAVAEILDLVDTLVFGKVQEVKTTTGTSYVIDANKKGVIMKLMDFIASAIAVLPAEKAKKANELVASIKEKLQKAGVSIFNMEDLLKLLGFMLDPLRVDDTNVVMTPQMKASIKAEPVVIKPEPVPSLTVEGVDLSAYE